MSAIDANRSAAAPKYIEAVRASGFTFRSTDVGAVLDLMIHDLDLVLALVRSPVRKVEAMGLSVLGGHEDVANARLEFESGCVATLSAARVSYEAVRHMHVWSLAGYAGIDFATRKASLIHASAVLQERQFDIDSLSPEQVEHYKQHLLEEYLPQQQLAFDAVDALCLELQDFVGAIRTHRDPVVTGEHGRDAVLVAEQILSSIESHAWDGHLAGRIGPQALPGASAIPGPHWQSIPSESPRRRQAG
jgi:predicted dehydrogenase